MSSSTSGSATSTRRLDLKATVIRSRFCLFCFLCLLPLIVVSSVAFSDDTNIDVLRHGVTTPLVLPEYKSQGVGYASMRDVARQINGVVSVDAARVTFRLDGVSANAGLNDTGVESGTGAFALTHPILAYEGDALIAMDDVVPFLRNGFGFGTPDAPPATSALALPQEPVSLEEDGGLESAMEASTLDAVTPAPAPASVEEIIDLESIEISTSETTEEPETPLVATSFGDTKSFVLAIDPGHGGEDSGVLGRDGLLEKELSLAVATTLSEILKDTYGITSVLIRDKDEAVTPAMRLSRAKSAKATLVLSIHGGASNSPAAKGYQVYAHKPKRSLSIDPKPALGAAQTLAGALDSATSQTSGPVRETPLLLVHDGALPMILVELGMITNPDEEARLSSPSYQAELAAALAQGIHTLLDSESATRNSL